MNLPADLSGLWFAGVLLLPVASGALLADAGPWFAGTEVQAYPAGTIAGVNLEKAVADRDLLLFRAGVNRAYRQDFGEHDREQGGGPGGTLGYVRFFQKGYRGWAFGVRLDYWRLEIDWWDNRLSRPERNLQDPLFLYLAASRTDLLIPYLLGTRRRGRTGINVWQPTVEARVVFSLRGRLSLGLSMAVGAERNTRTHGEAVGQGPILLWGVSVMSRL